MTLSLFFLGQQLPLLGFQLRRTVRAENRFGLAQGRQLATGFRDLRLKGLDPIVHRTASLLQILKGCLDVVGLFGPSGR